MTALLWLALVGCVGQAAGTDVDALVAQLASADFQEREAAHKKLLSVGVAARPALEKALLSNDVEQKMRADEILRELRKKDAWSGSTVTLKKTDAPISEVLREIEVQTGNKMRWRTATDGAPFGKATVDWSAKPYWQVLDEFSQTTKLVQDITDDPHQSGFGFVLGNPRPPIAFYSGPIRLRLAYANRNANIHRDYIGGIDGRQESLDYNFELHWEQRLAMSRFRSRLRVLEAKTDTDEELRIDSTAHNGMMHVLRRQRQLTFASRLAAPKKNATKLTQLRLEGEFVLAGEFQSLEVPLASPNRVEKHGYTLDAGEMKPSVVGWEVTFEWSRPLPLDAVNTTDLADEYFELFDADGETVDFSLRQVIGDRSSVKYTFTISHNNKKPTRLAAKIATLRGAKKVVFTFNDVPLPALLPGG